MGRGRLALWVLTAALTVGLAVSTLAASSGAGDCSPGLDQGPGDAVCYALVRTLATRVGVMAAAATAILVLTMVGLARTDVPRLDEDR
jgi:hypothetical protein